MCVKDDLTGEDVSNVVPITRGARQLSSGADAAPYVGVWQVLKALCGLRMSLNRVDLASSRVFLDRLHASTWVCNCAMRGLLGELEAELEVESGNTKKAAAIYRTIVIPAYRHMPRLFRDRAIRQLMIIQGPVEGQGEYKRLWRRLT